ncbi:MAG TPA: hypothetical protein DEF79_08925 [Gammaproteobacteria bacterium]|nr:hypothetical protein [Gammaproteobacteria bacterium]
MTRLIIPALSCTLLLGSAGVLAGERVGDFALIDNLGTQHHMSWYDDHQAVVIAPQANGETDTATLEGLTRLKQKYQGQGVAFFMINPGLQTDREAVTADVAATGIDLPVLMDDTHLVTEMLGIERLDEAVVYDPTSFEISYRGPVGGSVEAAIDKLLAGENADLVSAVGSAAFIDSNIADHTNLSYTKDIAPIIASNCATCHRDGGVAPFAMDSSLAVQGWSPMIREVIMTKRMPPGQIDNKVGHRIKNAMNLSDNEMQMLVRWVGAGSPVDLLDDVDPLTQLVWPDTKWTLAKDLGEPDLIVKVPPQAIPATGVIDYRDIVLDLGLEEDQWVRASEVAPDKTEVLHHIITTVVPPGGRPDPMQAFTAALDDLPEDRAAAIRGEIFTAVASGKQPPIGKIFRENPDLGIGQILGGDDDLPQFGGYAPGNAVSLAPEGVGGLLKAGTSLSLQMHYTTSGREVTDETEIGIYFYPEGEVPTEKMTGGVGNEFDIAIPAFSKDHEMEVVTYIKNESDLYSLMPHMHFRGKRMRFVAEYPDGNEELLLSVPDYDFNWQLVHELEEPIRVPAGTRIRAIGAFDNSAQNRANPDPSIDLKWGEQSFEEMFMGFYAWKEANQGGDD